MIIVEVKKRLRLTPLVLSLIAFFALATTVSGASDHDPPSVRPATDFPAVETHPDENVSIAADPYNTPEKCSIFRVDYLKYGYMPIRLIVTNNGDKPISLVDARIHLITRDGDKIPAAKPSDIERASTFDSKAGRTIPLPAPLPPMRGKAKTSTKNIEADFATFEYAALAVEPHTTRAGFLFYDVAGLSDPLKGAHLYLRMLHSADGKDLFYFEIPLDKYPGQPKVEKRPAD
jgi:hypothetical protein